MECEHRTMLERSEERFDDPVKEKYDI